MVSYPAPHRTRGAISASVRAVSSAVADPPEGRRLGPTERALWLLDRGASFNGVHVVRIAGALDAATVAKALARVQARHPLLRMRVSGGDRAPAYEATSAPIPIEVVPRESDDAWQATVERELNLRFPAEGGLLVRAVLVAGTTRSELVLSHHHMIGDAQSFHLLLDDLLDGAAAIAEGGEPAPLDRLPLRPPLAELLRPSVHGLRRFLFMSLFFFRTLFALVVRRPRKLPRDRKAPPEERRNRLVHRALSVEETTRLAERCRREQASVQGALSAALVHGAAVDLGLGQGATRPATLGCFAGVSLRPDLSLRVDEEMGLYMSQVATYHRAAISDALWPRAREVKRALARALAAGEQYITLPMMGMFIPGGDDPGPAFIRRFDDASTGAVGVTNLGRVALEPRYGSLAVEGFEIAVGASVFGRLLAAVSTCAGALSFNVVYVEPLVSRARAERIADAALEHLRGALDVT